MQGRRQVIGEVQTRTEALGQFAGSAIGNGLVAGGHTRASQPQPVRKVQLFEHPVGNAVLHHHGVCAKLDTLGECSLQRCQCRQICVIDADVAGDAIGMDAARQMPGQKLEHLARLKAAGRHPLMIGDGLNDAPALAAGHASLSPASAMDITQTAADAIVQGDRLGPVLEAIAVARASRRMAFENFAIALGYNVVFVPLAMVGYVTPLLAAVAMSASSIAVTANALRLRRRRLTLGSWSSQT